MKKNRWYLRLLALLVLCGALNVTITAAAEAGSSDDPLVTLSYLNETFMDSIMERVDQKIAARNAQLGVSTGSGTSTASTFTVVTLTSGQTLTGDIGCEVMLRVGTAACVSPSQKAVSSDGSSLFVYAATPEKCCHFAAFRLFANTTIAAIAPAMINAPATAPGAM